MKAQDIFRHLVHMVFRTRQFNNHHITAFARGTHNQSILEIGSGKLVDGDDVYSSRRFFPESNLFEQTDFNPDFGHRVLDVTTMNDKEVYDVIICMSVLEHVFDYEKGIANLYNALKPGGKLLISLPVFYPLHDEPHDYWRFTEHAVKRIFSQFTELTIAKRGLRQFPFCYFISVTKPISATEQ